MLPARTFTIILALSTTLFAAPVLAHAAENAANAAPAVSEVTPAPEATATPIAGDERADLAAREASAKNLEDFRGGDEGIYIGSGVLVVVLVILLLILLLR